MSKGNPAEKSFLVMLLPRFLCLCRTLLHLLRKHLPLLAEMPLLQLSWSSLLAFEDLPEFSNFSGIPSEHLIQSLFYRIRKSAHDRNLQTYEEAAKVTRCSTCSSFVDHFSLMCVLCYLCPVCVQHADKCLTHILTKVEQERDR